VRTDRFRVERAISDKGRKSEGIDHQGCEAVRNEWVQIDEVEND